MTVDFQNNFINFRYSKEGDIMYQTQKNIFLPNTGLTIQNPDNNIEAYSLVLNQWGTSLQCGHIIDNIVGYLKNSNLENIILIVDFDSITNVSESFWEQYLRFMLSTKSKIININQNTNISNSFTAYIENMIDIQDLE